MITNKGKFTTGMVMMIAFMVVLVAMFLPIFGGKNGLQYLDDLYNSISKGSADYFDKVRADAQPFAGKTLDVTIKLSNPEQAAQVANLLNAGKAMTNVTDASVKVSGDLGAIIDNAMVDARALYENKGDALQAKYGYDARRVGYNWYQAIRKMEDALNKQEQFQMAKVLHVVNSKTVETAYNYYGIEGQKISERVGVVLFSLVFYVIYTLWYGFGIMFLFEGIGMQLEH